MEIIMAAQEDSTPWPVESNMHDDGESMMHGRSFFSELGVVRRKPCV
jgi:hypothetical protein